MKRRDEFSVGLSVILSLVVLTATGILLGNFGPHGPRSLHTARFRTVGGVSVGDPVVMRGVKVGRVEAIRLAPDDWVEADLRITSPEDIPRNPVAIAASASLFGEWQVTVLDQARIPDDPGVRLALEEAREATRRDWPGATLPDIGQLTAQASRIAGDIAEVTNRVQAAVDSAAISDIRGSVGDLRRMAAQLLKFTQEQTGSMQRVVGNAATSSDRIVLATEHLEATLSRVDSSTASGEVADLIRDARAATADLRLASGDFRLVANTAAEQRERLTHIVETTDAMLSRIDRGEGSLGMFLRDTTLYRESTQAVATLRKLLEDIQANPRRYFRFSVF